MEADGGVSLRRDDLGSKSTSRRRATGVGEGRRVVGSGGAEISSSSTGRQVDRGRKIEDQATGVSTKAAAEESPQGIKNLLGVGGMGSTSTIEIDQNRS